MRLLDPRETAQLLRVSLTTLARWRMQGAGPGYVKLGKCVRYPETDLLRWLEAHRVSPSQLQGTSNDRR